MTFELVAPAVSRLKQKERIEPGKSPQRPQMFFQVGVIEHDIEHSQLVTFFEIVFCVPLNEKNIPEMRTVELGPLQEDNMRVIRKGLNAGERIVKDNLLRIRLDRPVEPIND